MSEIQREVTEEIQEPRKEEMRGKEMCQRKPSRGSRRAWKTSQPGQWAEDRDSDSRQQLMLERRLKREELFLFFQRPLIWFPA